MSFTDCRIGVVGVCEETDKYILREDNLFIQHIYCKYIIAKQIAELLHFFLSRAHENLCFKPQLQLVEEKDILTLYHAV